MDINLIYLDVKFAIEFNGIEITITNNKENGIEYSLRQRNVDNSVSATWQTLKGSVKEYILNDFKKTPEHQEIVSRIKSIL